MTEPIDLLKKAFQQATHSSDQTQPWEEPLARFGSAYPQQVMAAPPVPLALGSWVSSGGYPYQAVYKPSGTVALQYNQSGLVGPSFELSETNPGAPGYSDLNYVPYNYGTNRFGSKGGALLGHPISWEVVGPTLKSPYTHWQWSVTFNPPTVADVLTLDEGPLSGTLLNGGVLPTVTQAYNLASLATYDAAGGLYVLVTFTGNGFDNATKSPGVPVTDITTAATLTNPYEVFRVTGISGQTLSLSANKKLANYFVDAGGTPTIRAITLIRPKVTRLAAFPLRTGITQTNQVFVFVPPTTAATSEHMPPYIAGTGASPNCPSWTDGNFGNSTANGNSANYGCASRLPIPTPISTFVAEIPVSVPGVANRWVLTADFPGTVTPTAGQIVRISTLEQNTVNNPSSVFGWFEIAVVGGMGPFVLTLNRVPEVDQSTGSVYYGDGPYCSVTSDGVTGELYNNIGSLFTDRTLNLTKLSSARLQNLIDPHQSSFSDKGMFASVVNGTPVASYKPDKAIFDTRASSLNPGNLMDLGFRVVLYPAKSLGGVVSPDFDNPIDTNNVILDPSIDEEQYLQVDYSAGVLYLSHPPVPGVGCTVAPHGVINDNTNNPRREVVLFAACVPYSMEEGQTGGGIRVQVSNPTNTNGFGRQDFTDLLGSRVILTPDTGVLSSGGSLTFTTHFVEATDIPRSFFFLLYERDLGTTRFEDGNGPYFCPYFDTGTGTFNSICFPAGAPAYTVTENTRLVLLKSGNRYINAHSLSDGVRGSSKRISALRFKNAIASYGADGSVTLDVQAQLGLDDAYDSNSSVSGSGRQIIVDGKAVLLTPTSSTAGGDELNASLRVDTRLVGTPRGLVGYDFVGELSGISDPFSGFLDRRAFTPGAGATILGGAFPIEYSSATKVKMDGGSDFFWTAGAYNATLLHFGFDLIEVLDDATETTKVYVITGYGSTGDEVIVTKLDGSSPGFVSSNTGIATVYRVKFQTGHGASTVTVPNINTWVRAQADSPGTASGDYGALNIFAGSGSAIGVGDGGGSRTALAFWSRNNYLGTELNFSTSNFDTLGRFNSTLTGALMTGASKPDYYLRGDYVSRSVKELGIFSSTSWATGHIVEDFSKDAYRYDFLSLMPLVTLEYEVTFSAASPIQGLIEVDPVGPPLPPDVFLIPFGAAMVDLISTTPDPASTDGVLGLYLLRGYDTGGTGNQLILRTLANAAPATLPVAGTGVIRLYVFSSQGLRTGVPYYIEQTAAAKSQTASQTIGIGVESNAVGLYIAGPGRFEVGGSGADRYALRVTSSDAALAGVNQPGNNEVANLDLGGNYQGADYLYEGAPKTVIKDLNMTTFHPAVNAATNGWYLSIGSPSGVQDLWWENTAVSRELLIPIPLPASSTRVDTLGIATHLSTLMGIAITGYFYGSPGLEAKVSLALITNDYLAPSSNVTYQHLSGATSVDLPTNVGPQTVTDMSVTNPGGGPLVIDNETQYLVLQITANGDGGTSRDQVYGVRITWKDPGPRNY